MILYCFLLIISAIYSDAAITCEKTEEYSKIVTSKEGWIQNRGFPGYKTCTRGTWLLTASRAYPNIYYRWCIVNLEARDRSAIGTTKECSYDYVYSSAEPNTRYCGEVYRYRIHLAVGNVTVIFSSDILRTHTGFRLAYCRTNDRMCEPKCPDEKIFMHPQHRAIASPGFPKAYRMNVDKCWTLRTGSPELFIWYKFCRFNLEPHFFCNYDFVIVNDGPKMCGRNPKYLVRRYAGPSLVICFHSDMRVTYPGFYLEYCVSHKPCKPGCSGLKKLDPFLKDYSHWTVYSAKSLQSVHKGTYVEKNSHNIISSVKTSQKEKVLVTGSESETSKNVQTVKSSEDKSSVIQGGSKGSEHSVSTVIGVKDDLVKTGSSKWGKGDGVVKVVNTKIKDENRNKGHEELGGEVGITIVDKNDDSDKNTGSIIVGSEVNKLEKGSVSKNKVHPIKPSPDVNVKHVKKVTKKEATIVENMDNNGKIQTVISEGDRGDAKTVTIDSSLLNRTKSIITSVISEGDIGDAKLKIIDSIRDKGLRVKNTKDGLVVVGEGAVGDTIREYINKFDFIKDKFWKKKKGGKKGKKYTKPTAATTTMNITEPSNTTTFPNTTVGIVTPVFNTTTTPFNTTTVGIVTPVFNTTTTGSSTTTTKIKKPYTGKKSNKIKKGKTVNIIKKTIYSGKKDVKKGDTSEKGIIGKDGKIHLNLDLIKTLIGGKKLNLNLIKGLVQKSKKSDCKFGKTKIEKHLGWDNVKTPSFKTKGKGLVLKSSEASQPSVKYPPIRIKVNNNIMAEIPGFGTIQQKLNEYSSQADIKTLANLTKGKLNVKSSFLCHFAQNRFRSYLKKKSDISKLMSMLLLAFLEHCDSKDVDWKHIFQTLIKNYAIKLNKN